MSELYNRIDHLCKKRGTNITALCKEANVGRATLSELNAGRTKTLTLETARKLAAALKISVGELMGDEQTEKTPTKDGEREITERDIKAAFFHGADMTDEEIEEAWEDVIKLRDIVLKNRKRDKGDQ